MKKLFNNNVMRVVLALGMFAFAGCVDNKIDSQPSAAPNIQDDAQLSYDMAAESAPNAVFNISANTPWRISSDSQWCKVTPSMSAVGGLVSEVYISVEDNEDYAPRTAVLTISGVELEYTKTISVVQASKTDFIVTEFGGTIPTEGGVATYRIRTNKKWEYFAVDDFLYGAADVESAEDVDAVADYELNITVPANTGVRRACRFLIRTAAGDHEYSFSQNGITLELAEEQTVEDLTFSAEDAPAYGAGATVTFLVNSNTEFVPVVADKDADWLEIESYDATSVTVKTKGGINPYMGKRQGIVNLTAGEIDPVPVTVYQPAMFTINWGEYSDSHTTMYYIDNDDQSLTFYPAGSTGTAERLAIVSPIKIHMGKKWVIEFDPERTNIDKSHLYFHISPDGSTAQGSGISRAALTPNIPSAVDGINNNCFLHNGGTWTGNINRWNIDGVGGGVTPEEPITSDDVKRVEKVAFEMTELGVKMVVVANGKEFSYTRLLSEIPSDTNRELFTTAYKVVELYAAFGFFNSDYANEYVTVTKSYFADIE